MTIAEALPKFVDTHAHLSDDQFAGDAADVIAAAADVGVTRILNVAFSHTMWHAAIKLSEMHSGVSFTLGIHPNSADEWDRATAAALATLVSEHRPAAIGETGLDYYWNTHPRQVQIEAFSKQVALAQTAALPVIIHMRGDVEDDIRDVLSGRDNPVCVFHSFDGSAALAEWIVSKGWYLGVGGLMTRRSARSTQDILKLAPLDQLLLETDSPYLAPTSWKEKRNTPVSVPIIAGHLARLHSLSVDEIAEATTANAIRVLRLPEQLA